MFFSLPNDMLFAAIEFAEIVLSILSMRLGIFFIIILLSTNRNIVCVLKCYWQKRLHKLRIK